MSAAKIDTGPPFGTVYFGVVLAVIGLGVTISMPDLIGPVLAIAGVMLVCTGLILRGLYRAG